MPHTSAYSLGLLGLVAASLPLFAQVSTTSAMTCTASADGPAILSIEGVAELASDLVLRCQGGTPTSAGQAIPHVTLQVFLNTAVTSRLLVTSPDLSEALLLIDEPSPGNQLVCATLPCSITGTGGTASPYNGSAGHPNVFQATQIGGNSIEWRDVPLDPPASGQVRTLRIANVRADVNQFENCDCLGPLALVMLITTVPANAIVISNPDQIVGDFQSGLIFSTTTANISSLTPHNAGTPFTDLTMTFAEGFATAWKPRTMASHPDDTLADANQNIPGTVYASTSGFYNSSFTGTYADAGLATQGTRLIAHFENVPTGATLFVTSKPITASSTLHVQLISTGPNGDGPYDPVTADASGMTSIAVYDGSAIAVWEVLAASAADLESAQFGVAVAFSPDATNPFNQPATATVQGSLGPITGVRIASLTDPVPRFIEKLAQPAFTIANPGSPVISAVVNAANYATQSPLGLGSVAAIFGANLGTAASANGNTLPDTLNGTSVQINGFAAPIYATTSGQVNIQIPWELAGLTQASLTVTVNGLESASVTIQLAETAPYIFALDGQPLIAKELPVQPGSLLTIYGTGFGPVLNQPTTGSPANDLASTTVNPANVTIGGIPATVTFSGLAPGLAGVWEVIVKLPDGVAFGPAVPVVLTIEGTGASIVTIALP